MENLPNQVEQQIIQDGPSLSKVSSKLFGSKYNNKREVYNFLASDVGIYLPGYEYVTIYFLKDLMNGRKKNLNTKRIRTIHIPQYEGLGVKEIRSFLDDNHPEVYDYLPEPSLELPKVPKQWFANVCVTLLEEKFSNWVKYQTNVRHDKVTIKKDIMIQMDPEMAKVFHQSAAVSTVKGNSSNLLQTNSKRRRTKAQIEAEKEAELIKEQQTMAKVAQYDVLKAKVKMMEDSQQVGEVAANLMQQFIESGLIRDEGDGKFTLSGPNGSQTFNAFPPQE